MMGTFKCDNCQFATSDENQMSQIKDIWERVDPGGIMPSGECPHCNALMYVDNLATRRKHAANCLVDAIEGLLPLAEEGLRNIESDMRDNVEGAKQSYLDGCEVIDLVLELLGTVKPTQDCPA